MARGKSPEEKQRLEALGQAEKDYLSELKHAERELRDSQREYDKGVKSAEAELNRVRNPPAAGRIGSVTLREDRVETGSGAISLLGEPVHASVEARGEVVVQKDKKIDTRELYLTITGPALVHVEKCNPDQGDAVRQFAAKIENASRGAKDQKERRDTAIAEAESALALAKADRAAIDQAESRLAAVRAKKANLDHARREAGLDELPEQYFTGRRRAKRIVLWAAVALVALIALFGALAAFGVGGGSDTSPSPAAETTDDSGAVGDASEADADTTVDEETVESAPAPASATESGDTGRMSEGEYDALVRNHEKLVEESLQWSSGYETCAQIGLAGDLAGFRDCIDEAWEGFEGAALVAYGDADDTLDDVAKGCLKALRRYRSVVDRYYSTNLAARDSARALDFDAIVARFEQLPQVARRYANSSGATLSACEPQ